MNKKIIIPVLIVLSLVMVLAVQELTFSFDTGEDAILGYTINEGGEFPAIQSCGYGECFFAGRGGSSDNSIQTTNYTLDNGDFTIEMWLNFSADGNYQGDIFNIVNWRKAGGTIYTSSSDLATKLDHTSWSDSYYGTSSSTLPELTSIRFINTYHALGDGGGVGGTGYVDAYFSRNDPSNPNASDGWKHITLTYDRGNKNLSVYVDGILKDFDSNVEWLSSNEITVLNNDPSYYQETLIGNGNNVAFNDGNISFDEITYHNYTLNSSEVLSAYNNEKNNFYTFYNVSIYHNQLINISTYTRDQCEDSIFFNSTYNLTFCEVKDNTNVTIQWDSDIYNVTNENLSFIINSDKNIYIEYAETVFPNATINSPIGEYNTTQIPYNISTQENDAYGLCQFWITRGASLEVANTTVDCNSTITGTTYVSSQNTAYVFHAWIEDNSGNVNHTTSNFSTSLNATVILPPTGDSGGGGGGGSVVIVDNTDSWTFSTAGQTELYELSMSRGTSRDLTLKFTNNGDARTIDLTCENVEGSACQFVEFDQDEFDLALLKDVEQTVGFTITIPEDTEKARYSFNIIAKDETGRQGNISVLLNVGTGSILTLFFSKLFSTSPLGVPYILLFIFSLAILGFIFSKIFDKSNNKALFTFVFTLLISIGIIIVL